MLMRHGWRNRFNQLSHHKSLVMWPGQRKELLRSTYITYDEIVSDASAFVVQLLWFWLVFFSLSGFLLSSQFSVFRSKGNVRQRLWNEWDVQIEFREFPATHSWPVMYWGVYSLLLVIDFPFLNLLQPFDEHEHIVSKPGCKLCALGISCSCQIM